MAKYTRGAVRMDWLRKPSVEIAIPTAISLTPVCPSAMRITADAGVWVSARPAAPSARRQTQLTPT